MTGASNFLFYLTFSGLVAHELDAVHKHEWRLLFVLCTMPDASARRAFVLIHIPLFAVLLWLAAYPDAEVRYWTVLGLDVFMIVHAGLHGRLSGHPKYEFNTLHSRLLIYGTAALAAAHLLVLALARYARPNAQWQAGTLPDRLIKHEDRRLLAPSERFSRAP